MANTGQYDSQTNIETEDYEREIFVRPEAAVIYGGSVVNSVNGQVGDVVLTTSDLENTSDYQTGAQVQSAIAGKQDKLTAGSGLNLDGTILSVDTNIIATVQDVTDEATIRENSDANLQGQIDALTVSSGVIDVLGTYQDLQNYDTTHVKEDDIIKVLQDSTHSNAMSYYKWVITSNVGAWVYVGGEGPFYTKSEADVLLNSKQNTEDNSLDTTRKTIVGAINEVDSIAKGANQALSYGNYSTMVTAFNSLDDDVYKVGQNIYIVTTEVPDLWISGIESTSQTYTYTTDEAFTTELNTNGYVQVGYYKLSALETQKADLTNYVTFDDYATAATAGVIITNPQYGVSTSSYTKNLTGAVRTYAQYQSGNDVAIICKGTLENVITGKNLETSNNKVTSISSSSTNTEYPSAKAVYDYIQSLNGDEVNY